MTLHEYLRLTKAEAESKLQEPNKAIDSYRCFWEGRISLIDELSKQFNPRKKKQYPAVRICLQCGGLAHGNTGHEVSI